MLSERAQLRCEIMLLGTIKKEEEGEERRPLSDMSLLHCGTGEEIKMMAMTAEQRSILRYIRKSIINNRASRCNRLTAVSGVESGV